MITDHRFLANFQKYRFLLFQLVKKDIQVRYRNSVLGVLWSFLEPLLVMIVMTIVFSFIFKRSIPNFPVYYLIGRVTFQLFQQGTAGSLKSIIGNTNIIKSVYVPKYLFALSSVLSSFFVFLLGMIFVLVVMVVTNVQFTIYVIFASLPIIVLLILTVGVGLILATLTVFFRDIEHFYRVFTMLLMYSSAIFYPASIIPPQYQIILTINPLYAVISCLRDVLLNGVLYNPATLYYSAGVAVVSLVVGMALFYRYQSRFLLYL